MHQVGLAAQNSEGDVQAARLGVLRLLHGQDTFDTDGPAAGRCVGTTERGHQLVVAAPGRDRAGEAVGFDFPDDPSVIVEAAHHAGSEDDTISQVGGQCQR